MIDYEYAFRRLTILLGTGIFCENNGTLESFQENCEYNPLFVSEKLREHLMRSAAQQAVPYIYRDAFGAYFACILREDAAYLTGPMLSEKQDITGQHAFYHAYGTERVYEKKLKQFTQAEIMSLVELIAEIVTGVTYDDETLIAENGLQAISQEQVKQEQAIVRIRQEDMYHHTYLEERKLLDSVRDGRVEDALRLSELMDRELGKLSVTEKNHWKNVSVASITLCTRAAIEGGLPPAAAYRISDFYIQKCDGARDISEILQYRNRAVTELTGHVRELKGKKRTSNYTNRCKDYVNKHYREKIYLDDMAETFGISTTYLSKVFRKDTGICLRDYITEVRVDRAANLLLYSEEEIPAIAAYVNFPSQSYFGRVFKKYKNMTPRQYREALKPIEFIERTKTTK